MPRQSYTALQTLNLNLQRQVQQLSNDPAYGILTRPAIDFELARIHDAARSVVFMDVDGLHELNAIHGYEGMNGRIKRAVHVRAADVMLRARWWSGDEIIFVLAEGDPFAFCHRLKSACKSEGFTATFCHSPYSGDLAHTVHACAAMVQRAKLDGRRDTITALVGG